MSTVETRLDSLLCLIEQAVEPRETHKEGGWRAIVGTFANDPTYEEAMRLGRRWRENQM
jgi:hypothetical protein